MKPTMIAPLLFGLIGAAILITLGSWQVQRLNWKRAALAEIDARLGDPPQEIPAIPSPQTDRYQPVSETGTIGGGEIHVLASRKRYGAGYRVISPFTIGARRVLLDRGFLPPDARNRPRGEKTLRVGGNLAWPQEIDSFTPPPDLAAGIWFARDVPAMADALHTEPLLIVARTDTGDGIDPYPVDSAGIPNDHLQYAITWFSLAVVWLGMTAFLLWRIKRRTA